MFGYLVMITSMIVIGCMLILSDLTSRSLRRGSGGSSCLTLFLFVFSDRRFAPDRYANAEGFAVHLD